MVIYLFLVFIIVVLAYMYCTERKIAERYKVIKCAEAMAVGAEMPYDVASLHKVRQALRNKINELEKQL